MPLLKTYFRYLTHEDRARCQIELEKGEVRKFVIQYEIFIQGEWSAVMRFGAYSSDSGQSFLLIPDACSGRIRTLESERSDAGFSGYLPIHHPSSSFCFFLIEPPFN
jgi:hypothetical protein